MQIEKHTKLNNIAFILFVLLPTFSPCQFHSLFLCLVKKKKQFSLTWEVNLEIKEFNYCEKAGFRAIHTENDTDMFILWRHIIN